jgi:hypothetical protein
MVCEPYVVKSYTSKDHQFEEVLILRSSASREDIEALLSVLRSFGYDSSAGDWQETSDKICFCTLKDAQTVFNTFSFAYVVSVLSHSHVSYDTEKKKPEIKERKRKR